MILSHFYGVKINVANIYETKITIFSIDNSFEVISYLILNYNNINIY